ncbi:hypothetical protein [Acinetobacter baumannii]|uniref:hypothetical protein n=1 Tax=Acinetobacter baumannii TaxID=470 RepID=UPI00070800BE|nr:hypothetical protein [Acinetobacter baumannii]KQG35929.1 hypothetical protein APC38_00385 [Acinetobacter baumannii]MDC5544372.1 hypothetical protein [Acinetobacter baumannii]
MTTFQVGNKNYSLFDIKYHQNDRIYVNVTRNGKKLLGFSFGLLINEKDDWKSAKVIESSSMYVRAVLEDGSIVEVPKSAAKPVIKKHGLLILEERIYEKEKSHLLWLYPLIIALLSAVLILNYFAA